MKARILALFLFLGLTVAGLAEPISFAPGEISASVKGVLVADQTKEFTFRGSAGQRFDFAVRSERGEWLVVHVRDADKNNIFSNFDSGVLHGKGVLPADGDYSVYFSLRRPEVQREGRVDYLLTLTLHPKAGVLAIENGVGSYQVNDDGGSRTIQGATVALGGAGDAEITIDLDGDGFVLHGRWKELSDETAVIEISEAFGKKAQGRGVVVYDDEIREDGLPTHLFLRFDVPDQETHHDLVFGRP